MGGDAYLSLEEQDELNKAGIKYSTFAFSFMAHPLPGFIEIGGNAYQSLEAPTRLASSIKICCFIHCTPLPGSTEIAGNAHLSLEDQDEPYQAGIKYTAMPPTKRFRDMEQLSGVWTGIGFYRIKYTTVPPTHRFRDMEQVDL